MKITESPNGLLIQTEDEQENIQLTRWVSEGRQLVPKLLQLTETELPIMTLEGLLDIVRQGAQFFTPSQILRGEKGNTVLIDSRILKRKSAGRPSDMRTIQASLKLFLFSPEKTVLQQERTWRRNKYLAEVRDKSVLREVKKAKHNAARDANMCVSAAKKLVVDSLAKMFIEHPEMALPYCLLGSIVTDQLKMN